MNHKPSYNNIKDYSSNNILIYVDKGILKEPFFNFYNESKELIKDFKIDVSNIYLFKRLNEASSHPFYISDNGYELQSNFIEITGDGSFDKGIKGNQEIYLIFHKPSLLPKNFQLYYYCTSHDNMLFNFNLINNHNDVELEPSLPENIPINWIDIKNDQNNLPEIKIPDEPKPQPLPQKESKEESKDEPESEAEISKRENYDLIKGIEYKEGNFLINLFSQDENKYLDIGSNQDGTKGFINISTYAFDKESNEYVNINTTDLQNSNDYRGETFNIWNYWIDEWKGSDSFRFDLKYIDSKGKEYLDHYYYDSVNGANNKPTKEKLAGESDLKIFQKDKIEFIQQNEKDSSSNNDNEIEKIGLSTYYLDHDELQRKFLLYIPSSYQKDSNYPLLLNFHGGSSNAIDQLNMADMRKLSDDNGFILCYPEGTPLENGELHWNPLIAKSNNKSATNDISFVDYLINFLKDNLSIDSSKVYATGYSNGAGLAYSLAFHLSNQIAAVAPVSGSMYEYINDQKIDYKKTSVINFNGDNDYERPFGGIEGWFNSVPESINYWIESNKIFDKPIVEILLTGTGEEIEYLEAIDIENNVGVESYKIINGGHKWYDFNINGKPFNQIIWDSLSKYSQEENLSEGKSESDSLLTLSIEEEEKTLEEVISEPYQTVSASSDEITFSPGEEVSFDLPYTTSDNNSSLTGLGLNVHYDSSIFTPSGDKSGVTTSLMLAGEPSVNDDNANKDNDLNTDKYISISWMDIGGNFPGSDLPATIANLKFSSSKDGIDSLTGESKESTINFTSTAPAENYDFMNDSVVLKPQTFNLDVDGNGKVTALGDGLMVIRKLFGSAFDGAKLTDKAISSDATRDHQGIHDYIQAGIDDNLLDIDGNGKVTALGDGLMVIRKLFGSAFDGEKLTDKAISNNASRTTDEIHEYISVMVNFDSFA